MAQHIEEAIQAISEQKKALYTKASGLRFSNPEKQAAIYAAIDELQAISEALFAAQRTVETFPKGDGPALTEDQLSDFSVFE